MIIMSEQNLLKDIIPNEQQHRVFEKISEPVVQALCSEGEALILKTFCVVFQSFASRVRRCASRSDFSTVLCLFPILKHLQTIKPDFDQLFRGYGNNVKSRIHSFIITLQTTINKSLEEFVESIRNYPDTKLPRDGTVHEVTSNVMVLLEQLHEYMDLLPGTLSVNDQNLLLHSTDPSRMVLAQYITAPNMEYIRGSSCIPGSGALTGYYQPGQLSPVRVLSALGLMIQSKSEAYNDAYLRAIFRLNNLHYILKSLQRTNLLDIVSVCTPNIKEYYNDQITDQKRIYSQSWSRVLYYVMEVDKPISQQRASPSFVATMKLKDKDKQNIKEKFNGFNKEVEEITRIQKNYAIPDHELRQSLKETNKDFILPKYQLFYDKYSAIPFSKNSEKYLRYSVDDVAAMISQFFDAAA
ncbi:EXOC7 [Cordylochernes scorpioides]|uniref:Exocyst complex component 7 n=1 Tax=Cordylochernes scorpioides TaxID=51811 RepID=A0ABY6L7C2_9ARAC|nr:EXOC7 [Cordylochernes scorpioides]